MMGEPVKAQRVATSWDTLSALIAPVVLVKTSPTGRLGASVGVVTKSKMANVKILTSVRRSQVDVEWEPAGTTEAGLVVVVQEDIDIVDRHVPILMNVKITERQIAGRPHA